jgi:hypothetical protein
MFKNVIAIHNQTHAQTRVKDIADFGFARDIHIAYVALGEMARASATYPIVFIEDSARDEFRPVALLGLRPGENLFIDAAGAWQAAYIPAVIRRYPFALLPAEQADQFVVCVDADSDRISTSEGAPLFEASGAPSATLENAKRFLSELHQLEQVTSAFCAWCKEHNMFSPLSMRIQGDGGARDLTGCYVINEERLNRLSDERFLEMRSRGYLAGIYAHLLSLAQIDRLAQLQRDRPGR